MTEEQKITWHGRRLNEIAHEMAVVLHEDRSVEIDYRFGVETIGGRKKYPRRRHDGSATITITGGKRQHGKGKRKTRTQAQGR